MSQQRNSSTEELIIVENQNSSEEESPLKMNTDHSFKDGHWNQHEIFMFISYLIYNRQTLKLKLQRRTNKVFKQMSDFIETRTSVQCRSQNQRLFRKFKNFRTIISAFKEEYGKDKFEADFKEICKQPGLKFKTELQKLSERVQKETSEQATQTDDIRVPSQLHRPQPHYVRENPLGWRHNYWNVMPNVMLMPYYS